MKNLLLIPFFLFAPVFSNPQDAGLHLFGPQNKIVDFTLFNIIIGKFNCKQENLKLQKVKITLFTQKENGFQNSMLWTILKNLAIVMET